MKLHAAVLSVLLLGASAGVSAQSDFDPNATLTLATNADPTLNPWTPGAVVESNLINTLVFDQLVRYNKDDFRKSFKMIQPLYNVAHDPEAEAARLAQIPFRFETHNWAFSRNQADYDITDKLKAVQTPTLVTVGRHDWITPLEASEELASVLPNSELVVFEHSGHSPQLEETDRYLAVVKDFLARHGIG